MEQKKIIYWILLLVFPICLNAQEKPIIRSGLTSGQLTLAPSYMFQDRTGQFYAHGSLEVFLQPKVSFIGEGFYHLGSLDDKKTFDANHNIFFGLGYHFTKGANDLLLALQPGVSFTKLNEQENALIKSHLGVNPVVAPTIGYTIYVSRFFHFFVQSKLVIGGHKYDVQKSLTEFRFSAGLGFNINALK
jgi:hypothetical protein